MIITQTPFRVSFAGGGTDLPAFYREEAGAVLSVTIARHIYVTVHGRFKDDIRVAYSKTETRNRVADIEHELVREAMILTEQNGPVEITTIGDVPAGTGMGSSSTLTVGMLNALYAYSNRIVNREQLAAQACDIEINRLQKPIGRQDQYAAAQRGMNYIRFNPDDSVDVEPVPCHQETFRALEDWTMLLYTDQQRNADTILKKQSEGTKDRMNVLRQMRDLADPMRQALAGEQADMNSFAELLHESWELKRSLGFGISMQAVEDWYNAARKSGAIGGKLLGAGGGGFLLLLAPPDRHAAIRTALGHPKELAFQVDRAGSRVIFVSEQH